MIRGEDVVLQRPRAAGTNARHEAKREWDDETIANVIVTPGPLEDIDDATRPAGVVVAWSLLWPKTFTGSLVGCRVRIRGGAPLAIIGDPQPYLRAPTQWNRPSEVTRADG